MSHKDDEGKKFITNLEGSVGDITTDMLKQTTDTYLDIRTQIINTSTDNKCYHDNIKLAEVSQVFKKNDDLDEKRYRPASALTHVFKSLEKNYVPTNTKFYEGKTVKSFNKI